MEKTGWGAHLVAEQHEHHVVLGVLLDLSQPGLVGEAEARLEAGAPCTPYPCRPQPTVPVGLWITGWSPQVP